MDPDNALVKAKDNSESLAKPQLWPVQAFPEQKKDPHLRDYWHVLCKHRWIVLTCFLVTVITVATATFVQQSVYKATATIQIDKAAPNVLKFEEVSPPANKETDDYYQTQYKLLMSYSLAERVVRLLRLDANPEFTGTGAPGSASPTWTWLVSLVDSLYGQQSPQQTAGDTPTTESPVVQRFLKKLDIEPVKNTRLVKIAFLSASPELSAQ